MSRRLTGLLALLVLAVLGLLMVAAEPAAAWLAEWRAEPVKADPFLIEMGGRV